MPIRLSGLSSGMDTEALVSALVSAYSIKKDDMVKAQTKLSWKQDKWKTMNTSIYNFHTGQLSSARLSQFYSLKSASISNSSYAKVTAASSAVNGTQSLKVTELAATGYLTGGKITGENGQKLSGDSKLSSVKGLSDLAAGGSLSVTVDGTEKKIALSPDMSLDQLTAKFKDAGLSANFDAANQRFFVNSKTSGKDHDFTLTADNAEGMKALQKLGLYTTNATDQAEYQKWAEYATNSSKLDAAVEATYEKVKATYADRAKHFADTYNSIKDAMTAITKDNGSADDMKADIAQTRQAMEAAYKDDYAARDENGDIIYDKDGNVTFDTDKIEADGKLEAFSTLQNKVNGLTQNVTTVENYQKYMDEIEPYVNFDADGNAVAATASDADPTKYNALVDKVDQDNAATKASILKEYTDKANYAVEALKQTASEGAVRITGVDATIELNGAVYTNNTNNFSINGLTIEATALTGNETVSITTGTDVDGIYDSIKSLLKEYNDLIKSMDEAYNATSSKGYEPLTSEEKEAMTEDEIKEWEKKIKDSLLRKDSILGNTASSLKNDMMQSFEINGKMYSLSSFGIGTLGYFTSGDNEKGVLHIDGDKEDSKVSGKTDKLRAAIANDPETVVSFFSQLATNMHTDLGNRMASSSLSSAFTIYNDKEMLTEYSEYSTKISDQEDKVTRWEDYYYKKFTAMESALAALNSQSSSLTGLLGK